MKCKGRHALSLGNESYEYSACNEEIGHDGHTLQTTDFTNGHLTFCWDCDRYIAHRRAGLQESLIANTKLEGELI